MNKRFLISQHMIRRLKERFGIPKRAVERYVLTAYKNGKIVESIFLKGSQKIVINYKGNVFVLFEHPTWISFATVLHEASSKYNYYKAGKKFYDNSKNKISLYKL